MAKKKNSTTKELKILFKGRDLDCSFQTEGEDLFELLKTGFEDGYFYFVDTDDDTTVMINADDISMVRFEEEE